MNKNLIATILIIVAIGLYFTVTQNVIADAEGVKAESDATTQALSDASEIVTSRDQVTHDYNQISQADRAKLDAMIPAGVDNIRLVIDLNNLALQHHFSLTDVKAVVPSSSGGASGTIPPPAGGAASSGSVGTVGEPQLDKVVVSFTASTRYDQFISFLQALEADERVMSLRHLTVGSNDDGVYDFQAEFETYWLRR